MGAASPAKAARGRRVVQHAPEPPELANLYGPPQIGRLGGADDVSLDFNTPDADAVAEVPLEKLFSINGKDYFIPVEFPPGVSIAYLHGVEEGRDVALGRCLKTVIGEKGWNELAAFVTANNGGGITRAQMGRLLNVVMTKVMGSLEDDGEGNG